VTAGPSPHRGAVARLALGALAVAIAVGGCAADRSQAEASVQRVLVVSLPGVTWRDVDARSMPNLHALAQNGAVGNLANRVGRRPADAAAAYLTMGAGTRAFATGRESGAALAPGELINGVDARGLLARRLGRAPSGISYPSVGPISDHNDRTVYGADVGMLGDELAAAGVDRAVIANADRVDEIDNGGTTADLGSLHREAVAFLMGSDGSLPAGEVSSDLLARDPALPFGVGLDPVAVEAALGALWPGQDGRRSVLLVEASDLRREAQYRRRVTPSEQRSIRRRVLADADTLLGTVLDVIDPATDAVVVVGVPTSPGRPDLGLAALSAPGVHSGLLRTATTGRDGYVQLADLAPTVLNLLGEAHPGSIEGRPFVVTEVGGGPHIRALARDVSDAAFRDRMVPGVTVAFIAVLAALLAAGGPWAHPGPRRRKLLQFASYSILGAAAGTFLAGAHWASPATALPYAATVAALGLVVGALASAAERFRPGTGVLAALGAILAVVSLDVVLGAPLQVNTVFGYSVAVAGRFAGLGNLAFAIFSAAAVLFAVVAHRRGPRGRTLALVVLVGTIVLDGFPLLGADVGGSLAMVPAFGVTAMVLAGRRVRWLHLAALMVAGACVTATFALVDLARPEQDQTHLARFARLVLDGRWETLADSLTRRVQASFGGLEVLVWASVGLAGLVAVAYVVLVDRESLPTAARRRRWPRPLLAAGAGLGVLGILGWVANDSSGAVPATMLIVVVPVLVDHLVRPVEATT